MTDAKSLPVARLLVVEDEDPLRRMLARVLERAGYECSTAENAEEARRLLAEDEFDLMLTDVNMPGDSGLDLMVEVRAEYKDLATIMVTGVDDPNFMNIAVRMGAFGYIIKPFETNEVLVNVTNALRRRELEIESRQRGARLEQMVKERTAELNGAMRELQMAQGDLLASREETVDRLAIAAEFRDDGAAGHIQRMSRYCELIYARLGHSRPECDLMRTASILHDVGKIAVPDSILLAPRPLTDEEFDVMRTHCEVGNRILSGSDSELLRLAAMIALTHHEKVDGSGYPSGLVGEDIPLEGRVAAIADVFDALTTDRVYRPAISLDEAVGIMQAGKGSHFDSSLLDMFLASMDEVLAIKNEPVSPIGQTLFATADF